MQSLKEKNSLTYIILFLLLSITPSLAQKQADSFENLLNKTSGIDKTKMLKELADTCGRQNPDKLIEYSKRLLFTLKDHNKVEKAEAFYNIAMGHDYKNDYPNALQFYLKSAEISKEIRDDRKLIFTYNKIGTIYDTFGKYVTAYEYIRKALDLSTKMNDLAGLSNSLHNLGVILDTEGKLNQALEQYNKALKIRQQIGNNKEIIKSLISVGNIYRLESKYDSAFTYFHKALQISEKIKDRAAIANSMHFLGILYYQLKKYDKSVEHFNGSLKIWEEINDLKNKSITLGYLGLIYSGLNELQKSLQKHKEALSIRKMLNDVAGIATSLNNMADIYYKLGQYEKSLAHSFESLKIRENIGGEYGVAESRRMIANTYIKIGNYEKAIANLKISTGFALRENLSDKLALNYLSYSEAYGLKGDYKKSLEYYKLYSALNDSLLFKEYGQRVTELQIKYESEKREKEIEFLKNAHTSQNLELSREKHRNDLLLLILFSGFLLTIVFYYRYRFIKKTKKILFDKNNEIDCQKNKLEELNSTKDIFFSIIAHDLKNPFNTLINYSELLSNEYNNLSHEEIIDFINAIEHVSRKSYQLLENLLQWSKVQTGILDWKMENLELTNIINDCLQLLNFNAISKKIDIQTEFNGSTFIYSDYNLISTVLRNLLTNAIKFTPNGGSVKIITKEEESSIITMVEDNGIGMTRDTINKLFRIDVQQSSPGTSQEKGSGLGLILCKEFIEKSGGNIWVESEYGKGSRFSFRIRKALMEVNETESSRSGIPV